MRFFLLVAMSSACLSAMDNNNNNQDTMGSYCDVALRYCCSLVVENILTRYTATERERLLASANIQQSPQQPSLEERTCRACCKRHWGKICCCCTCCCISAGGGAIAFAGGIKKSVDAIKGAQIGIAGIMQ